MKTNVEDLGAINREDAESSAVRQLSYWASPKFYYKPYIQNLGLHFQNSYVYNSLDQVSVTIFL